MDDIDELVREEAYRIWESEGRPHGQDARHWEVAMSRVRARSVIPDVTVTVPLSVERIPLSARRKRGAEPETPARASV
jgi:hypothetical protein